MNRREKNTLMCKIIACGKSAIESAQLAGKYQQAEWHEDCDGIESCAMLNMKAVKMRDDSFEQMLDIIRRAIPED